MSPSARIQPAPALAIALTLLFTTNPTLAAQPLRFHDQIKPLLAVHCYKCHGPDSAKANLRLDLRDRALTKAESGHPAIIPGDSARSELVKRITSKDPDELMPQKGHPLSPHEIQLLRTWIDQGAPWPDKDEYWAFQPPTSPPAPTSTYPIDHFINSRLQAEKITPQPQADRRTLLRRAYADLLGVPPSPEETDAFLTDPSPHAYESLIDRLLADPRHGQRWARHWLDLVRYAESDGFEDDKIRPHAWRYRDYVIRSLNADKPYDRFLAEQIAGDELYPEDPDALIATGFARLGQWDGMSKEPDQRRQDFLNDATDAVGAVFMGVTIGCARCHDHKYDPISQHDYYALQAFFAGVRRETRELTPPSTPSPGTPGQGRGGGPAAPITAPAASTDPPHVLEALRQAQTQLSTLRADRDALLRKARQDLEWPRRCELDENAQLRIPEDQIKKQAERLHPGRLAALDQNIKDAEYTERLNRPAAEAVVEPSTTAPKTHLLKGGELARPGPEISPAFPAAMLHGHHPPITPPRSAKTTTRRTALARWLTSPDHPLTARVIVNRLWHHHFGRGIVPTPSDFGRQGQPPTHPDLLDHLAKRLIQDGWSLKKMHRLMMTSAAYQRSSHSGLSTQHSALHPDPENKLLWRANRRRLEAEPLRDSILAASARLSPTAGGPGVYPRISKDVNVQLPNNDKELSWYPCTEEENRRRTIYTFQRRSLTMPLAEVFDAAPMNQSCAARPTTTVAPQALTLLNGQFAREESQHFAHRLRKEAGHDPTHQIHRAFKITFARPPTPEELTSSLSFLKHQTQLRNGNESTALTDFCHVLLNSNEFLYID